MISGGSTTVNCILSVEHFNFEERKRFKIDSLAPTIIFDLGTISVAEDVCPRLYNYFMSKLPRLDMNEYGPPPLLCPSYEYYIADFDKVYNLIKACKQYSKQTKIFQNAESKYKLYFVFT
jgi:hypothetical protein